MTPGGDSPPSRSVAPRIAGILNMTEDSFSDGGRWLDPDLAVERAIELASQGADVIDLGAASSRPGALAVPPAEEIRRLDSVVDRIRARGIPISIDTFSPETQRWAIERDVDWLNDIQGFPDPSLDPALARARCGLIVMHSVQRPGPATRVDTDPEEVVRGIDAFFAERIARLDAAGVAHSRIVLDPGMGFFLGRDPALSLRVLRRIPALRARFCLPVLVSVSRKSFLGQLTGRKVEDRSAATLATELWAAASGVDWIRTHDVAALRDGLVLWRALDEAKG
ncbi:MAG: dihydropteroate synthase [Alphaproteobacteria bacterium]